MQGFFNKLSFIARAALLVGCVKLFSLLKVSWIVGSTHAFFSAKTAVAPLVGVGSGLLMCSAIPFLSAVISMLFSNMSLFILSVYHIPTLCASACWTRNNRFFTLILPLLCMALFIAHPVGGKAYFYSFYWFIPVVIQLFGARSVYARALQSSFVAHAVGSTLWLYGMPMTPAVWLGLIPVVALERLVVAGGMVAVYSAASWCTRQQFARLRIVRFFAKTL